MGDFPMMTDRGTFIINGTERIVVSQLVRSPGVYFGLNPDKTAPEKDIADAKMIPGRGAWLEFEIDKKDVVYVRIDRKRKQPVTVLLKALEFGDTDDELLGLITDDDGRPYESIRNTLEKDHTESAEEAFIDIYRKLRPGEPPTPDSARQLLTNLFFNPKRYDLAKVGRHKVTKKLVDEYPKMGLKRFGLETPTGDVDGGLGLHAHEGRHPRGDQLPREAARQRAQRTTPTTSTTSATAACARSASSSRTRCASACRGWSGSCASA